MIRPWLVAGDFNEILYQWEKEGGVPRPQIAMDRFKAILEDCDLGDLGFVGDAFTWRNHSHDANKYIKERLDRAVASPAWCSRFPGYRVINGEPRHCDHRPLIIDTHSVERCRRSPARGLTPRFEANWFEEEGCTDIIQDAWETEVNMYQKIVTGAVKGVLGELVNWSRNSTLGDMEKRISRLKRDLEACRRRTIRPDQVRREQVIRFKLNKLEEQRDLYWRQRAHVNWMKNGDKNTVSEFQQFDSSCRESVRSQDRRSTRRQQVQN
jgi:hypothetical protein